MLLRPDGTLVGDMFDGAGFARGLKRKGFALAGASCLVVGTGGVGSAIAASLAAEGPASISLFDTHAASAEDARGAAARALSADRGRPALERPRGVRPRRQRHAARHEGRRSAAVRRHRASRRATFVGEVVMKQEITPLLQAARDRGCRYQVGTDMLFEMIPAYLEFFGFGTATPDELRAVARVSY